VVEEIPVITTFDNISQVDRIISYTFQTHKCLLKNLKWSKRLTSFFQKLH